MQTINNNVMRLREFLNKTNEDKSFFLRPLVVLNNGETISIQASDSHFCKPRQSGLNVSYSEVEVYPNLANTLRGYDQGGGVLGWVNVDELEELIEFKGGINEKETLK